MKKLLSHLFVGSVQLFIVTIPVAIFAFLTVQELVPSGTFEVRKVPDVASPFIDRVLPDGRVGAIMTDLQGDRVVPVTGDPAFFFVHPHRSFDRVDVEVWFKNQGVPIVELGGLANAEPEAYMLAPLENRLIDDSSWHRLSDNGLILLQRKATYVSVGDFLDAPPARHEIATYQFDLGQPYRIAGYQPTPDARTIDVSLRGSHTYKTYVKHETLTLSAAYMDMNRDEGSDQLYAVVFNERGETVADTRADDDGNVGDDARPSSVRRLELSVPGLPEGVYKVELRASRDVFFRSLTTTQRFIVFTGSIYLGDEVAYRAQARAVRFWTEAKHVAFQTTHVEGVQTMQVGGTSVALARPYERVAIDVKESGVVRVTSPNADVLVEHDGHVAFAPEQFFNPDTTRLQWNTDVEQLGINYIIAKYTPPEHKGEWTVAHASFDAHRLLLIDGTWKFAFSAAGIMERSATLLIGPIIMQWHREPFSWHDVRELLLKK